METDTPPDITLEERERQMKQQIKESLQAILKEKYIFDHDHQTKTIEIAGVGHYPNFTHIIYQAAKEAVKEHLKEIEWRPDTHKPDDI